MRATSIFNGRFVSSTTTGADGRFSLAIEEGGQYVVVAYGVKHAASAASVVARPGVAAIELRLPPLQVD